MAQKPQGQWSHVLGDIDLDRMAKESFSEAAVIELSSEGQGWCKLTRL